MRKKYLGNWILTNSPYFLYMTKEEFIKKHCPMCGTQRCDSSDEWIDGCRLYNKLVLGIEPIDYVKLFKENGRSKE